MLSSVTVVRKAAHAGHSLLCGPGNWYACALRWTQQTGLHAQELEILPQEAPARLGNPPRGMSRENR
jgi:hypothetical protein